jgi:hypothetical protein
VKRNPIGLKVATAMIFASSLVLTGAIAEYLCLGSLEPKPLLHVMSMLVSLLCMGITAHACIRSIAIVEGVTDDGPENERQRDNCNY